MFPPEPVTIEIVLPGALVKALRSYAEKYGFTLKIITTLAVSYGICNLTFDQYCALISSGQYVMIDPPMEPSAPGQDKVGPL